MRRRRRYYEPEDLGYEQDRRDAAVPNRWYYVYVLDTDYGHYVGHTAHVGRRLWEHQDGEVASTAAGNPRLAWKSGALATRPDAAGFEAALKSLRDQRHRDFRRHTGLDPIPFAPFAAAARRAPARGPSRPPRYRRQRDDWFVRFLRREIRHLQEPSQATHVGCGGCRFGSARVPSLRLNRQCVLTHPRPLRAVGYTRTQTVADARGDDRDE